VGEGLDAGANPTMALVKVHQQLDEVIVDGIDMAGGAGDLILELFELLAKSPGPFEIDDGF
jgi:hypothetical protein